MRKLLLSAMLAGAALSGCSKSNDTGAPAAATEENLPTMSVAELDAALAAGTAQAVDCNGDKLRKKKGVVPDAILISDEETFAASELPTDKSARLVFYCSGPG